MRLSLFVSILLLAFAAQAERKLKCVSLDKKQSFELQGRINEQNNIEVMSVKINSEKIKPNSKNNLNFQTDKSDNVLKFSVKDSKSNKTIVSLDALIDRDLADVSAALVDQGNSKPELVNCVVTEEASTIKK